MSTTMKLDNLKLKIAEFIISLSSNGTKGKMENYQCHQNFIVEDDRRDIDIKVHYGEVPQERLGKKIFESESVWSLYKGEDSLTIGLSSPACGPGLYKVLTMRSDFSAGDVFVKKKDSEKSLPYPLDYPLDELLMINFLPHNQAMALHACGVIYEGKGIIFCGSPDAGKSTTANLWKAQEGAIVLNDERLIIRKQGEDLWVYGTPWRGDALATSPKGAVLDIIFFIKHASENKAVALSKKQVFSGLFTRSFPTYWDSKGAEGTLKLCSEVVEKVPGFELGFVPDRSMVDFVKNLMQENKRS